MRIISGIYKGRKLQSSKDLHIRPTTDRVKEFIFNILQDFPQNKFAADIFSGSGNLGIEALSRGAQKVVFVDSSQSSINVLKKNLSNLNIPENKYEIILTNALNYAKTNTNDIDLCLVDPPFVYPDLQNLINAIFLNSNFSKNSILVLEHEINNPVEDNSILYETIKLKKFGRSIIRFLAKRGDHG
jgi:16S rRNA (guanine(966)-N(2))-methyltransferase RsmD